MASIIHKRTIRYNTIRYVEFSNVRYDMRCHDVTLIQILKQKEYMNSSIAPALT